MHITECDGIFTAQHITGPTHTLLRLKIGRGGPVEFAVTVLPSIGECCHHNGLPAEDVIPAIRAGLAAANVALNSNFNVEAAEIVENDNRQPSIYEYLTRKIVEKAADTQQPPARTL